MLDFASILMRLLIIEGATLLFLVTISLILCVRYIHNDKSSEKKFKDVISYFKKEYCLNEKRSNMCKVLIILHGMITLTSVWCFTVLFGVVFISSIWIVIVMLVIEMLIMALYIRNKFILDKMKTIDLKWLSLKIESNIKNILPEIESKFGFEKNFKSIYSSLKKKIVQIKRS